MIWAGFAIIGPGTPPAAMISSVAKCEAIYQTAEAWTKVGYDATGQQS